MFQSYRRRVPPLLLMIIVVAAFAASMLPWLAHATRTVVFVSDIAPAEGKSFIGKLSDPLLSDHDEPTEARLYLVEERRGSLLHYLDPHCSNSRTCAWLTALLDANYPFAMYQARNEIGAGNSTHKTIADEGGGRFSVWRGHLYFSLPPGVIMSNVKRLELELPSALPPILRGAGEFFAWTRNAAIVVLAAYLFVPFLVPPLEWATKNVLPGLLITFAALGTLAIGCEFYFAGRFDKSESRAPIVFLPGVGVTYQPGATIKTTDGLNFWTKTRANSLGFADAEPVLPKPKDRFRILLVGDSFVEALQVRIEEKLQTLLTADLKKKLPNRDLDIVAIGMAGSGPSNDIPLYERSRTDISPDLVIYLFVNNDFANSSVLLDGVRTGWDPDYSPRLYLNPDCSRRSLSGDWYKHFLPATSYVDRARLLRARSKEIDQKFGDWTGETEMDRVFYDDKLPPVFEDALASAKCSFAEWKRLSTDDGFKLLVVATEFVEDSTGMGQIDRLGSMLRELDIPLLNLRPEFLKRGKLEDARFKFDGHWTPTGHRWAADAISSYLLQNGYLR